MRRSLTLRVIAVLVLLSLFMVGYVFAQSIPKPSVPEFTLKLVAHPYDVPANYETDPYTGEEVLKEEAYHVENRSIEITIKNQQFARYKLDDYPVNLFYNISYKGSYEKDWSYYAYNHDTEWFFTQSDTEYTIISFKQIPTEGKMDFRVQAQAGYYTYYYLLWKVYEFNGETSGWSEIQTVNIEKIQTTPSQSASPTPTSSPETTPTPYQEPLQTEPELIMGAVIAVTIIGAGLGFLIFLIKRK